MRNAGVRRERNVLRYTTRRSPGESASPMICDSASTCSLKTSARKIARWFSSSVDISTLLLHAFHCAFRVKGFIEQNVKCRNIGVPFDQCGQRTEPRQRL